MSNGTKPKITPCVVCKEPILEGARRCKHCQSFQGTIRRHFVLWTTVSGLIATLFGASFAGVDFIDRLNKLTDSLKASIENTHVSVQVSNSGIDAGLKALVTHEGSMAVTLHESVVVVIMDKNRGVLRKINHFFNAGGRDLTALTLQPGQQRTFYLNKSDVNEQYPRHLEDVICELHFVVQNLNRETDRTSSFNCW